MIEFKPGDRVLIKTPHPHATAIGRLVVFEPYGPALFGWKGWRVEEGRDDDWMERASAALAKARGETP